MEKNKTRQKFRPIEIDLSGVIPIPDLYVGHNIREIAEESDRLGRPLSDEECEKFLFKPE